MRRRAAVALFLAIVVMISGRSVVGALGDLVFERRAGPQGSEGILPAVFPHWIHRARFRCYVCHPAIFEMQLGSSEITMAKIREGQYCGKCHNGRIAFNVEFQTCGRCHREPPD